MKNYKQFFKTVIVISLLFIHFYSRSQSACPLTAVQKILTPTVCQNDPNAQVEFTATSQGTPPYVFSYNEVVNGGVLAAKTATTVGTNSVAVVGGIVTTSPGKISFQLTQIQDGNGCSTLLSRPPDTMTINPLPQATLSGAGGVCQGSAAPVLTFAGVSGTGIFSFTFTDGIATYTLPGKSNDSLFYAVSTENPGTFIYSLLSVKDKNCSNAISGQTAKVVIGEKPMAAFNVNAERISIFDPIVTINNFSIGGDSSIWNFGDNSVSLSNNPIYHIYKDTGTYKITLMTAKGPCKDSTYQMVKVYLPLKLFVPNAFTPNGDSINDEFKAQGDGITKFEMTIFDNHGQIAFTSNDIDKGWDGKSKGNTPPLQTFVYVINLRATSDKHDYTYRGVVTLVR